MAKFDDFDLDVTKIKIRDGEKQERITSISLCTSSCRTGILATCPFTTGK